MLEDFLIDRRLMDEPSGDRRYILLTFIKRAFQANIKSTLARRTSEANNVRGGKKETSQSLETRNPSD